MSRKVRRAQRVSKQNARLTKFLYGNPDSFLIQNVGNAVLILTLCDHSKSEINSAPGEGDWRAKSVLRLEKLQQCSFPSPQSPRQIIFLHQFPFAEGSRLENPHQRVRFTRRFGCSPSGGRLADPIPPHLPRRQEITLRLFRLGFWQSSKLPIIYQKFILENEI